MGKALEIAPANAFLLRRKSEIAARRGDLTEAFAWADRAVAANPAGASLSAAPVEAEASKPTLEIISSVACAVGKRDDTKKPRSGGLIGWLFS